jgi:hypothetical protein
LPGIEVGDSPVVVGPPGVQDVAEGSP